MADLETVFETERLRLEPIRVSHAPELFELLRDERLYRFIPQDPPETLAAVEDRFRRLESRTSPRGDELWLNWVLRSKETERCIGRVQATVTPEIAWLAYDLGADFWQRGFATEACRRICHALFADHGVTRIQAEVDTRNVASIRLLERLGFECGALKKDADSFKGSTSDEYTYILPRPVERP